jgi:hypothetical protein
VDPGACLDEMEERKFFTLPGLELAQPVASRYTDYAIAAPLNFTCTDTIFSPVRCLRHISYTRIAGL